MKEMTVDEFARHIPGNLMETQNQYLLITRAGKPIAVFLGIENKDEEDWRLQLSSEFWRMIEERRRDATVPWEQVKEELFACEQLTANSTLQKYLENLHTETEIRDPTGKLLGIFTPVSEENSADTNSARHLVQDLH
jgi:hypothetical protein